MTQMVELVSLDLKTFWPYKYKLYLFTD